MSLVITQETIFILSKNILSTYIKIDRIKERVSLETGQPTIKDNDSKIDIFGIFGSVVVFDVTYL